MNKVFIFTLGAVCGSLLTWKYVERKYKKIADEEIESVVERFNERNRKEKEDQEKNIEENISEEISDDMPLIDVYTGKRIIPGKEDFDYAKKVTDLGYHKYDDEYQITVAPGQDEVEPYLIPPERFGEVEVYETDHWTYYSDFTMINGDGDIVSDPEHYIGDALEHFGEYDDNAVYVRNEETSCDYEILRVNETFKEFYSKGNN